MSYKEVDKAGAIRYYNDKGQLHREDGHAIEYFNGNKRWYKNGKRHREDGPAIEDADGYRIWYKNGKRHREGGPSVEYTSGYKEWWLNGKPYTHQEYKIKMRFKKLKDIL